MGLFDFFKTDKEKNSRKIKEKIDIKKFEKRQHVWMEQLEDIFSKEDAEKIIIFHNLFFTQLKVNVFTLLAPVNLKDEKKLKVFYSHKFCIGFLFGFLFAMISTAKLRNQEQELMKLLMVKLMQDLFEFTAENAEKISNSISSKDPEYYESEYFKHGLVVGGKEWIQFAKSEFKSTIGQLFDENISKYKNEFQ